MERKVRAEVDGVGGTGCPRRPLQAEWDSDKGLKCGELEVTKMKTGDLKGPVPSSGLGGVLMAGAAVVAEERERPGEGKRLRAADHVACMWFQGWGFHTDLGASCVLPLHTPIGGEWLRVGTSALCFLPHTQTNLVSLCVFGRHSGTLPAP